MELRGTADAPTLEGYTTLGYIAALTERMRLAVLVTGVMYRYPGLLAKIVSTLDVLSGDGRSWASAPRHRGTLCGTRGYAVRPARR
jgi:hypothetical protein